MKSFPEFDEAPLEFEQLNIDKKLVLCTLQEVHGVPIDEFVRSRKNLIYRGSYLYTRFTGDASTGRDKNINTVLTVYPDNSVTFRGTGNNTPTQRAEIKEFQDNYQTDVETVLDTFQKAPTDFTWFQNFTENNKISPLGKSQPGSKADPVFIGTVIKRIDEEPYTVVGIKLFDFNTTTIRAVVLYNRKLDKLIGRNNGIKFTNTLRALKLTTFKFIITPEIDKEFFYDGPIPKHLAFAVNVDAEKFIGTPRENDIKKFLHDNRGKIHSKEFGL